MAKVKVWVAVAVDPMGGWSAAGWKGHLHNTHAKDEAMDMAVDGLGEGSGEARYWLTAELDVPEPTLVEASAADEFGHVWVDEPNGGMACELCGIGGLDGGIDKPCPKSSLHNESPGGGV